jgi:putative zinc finger protein
MHGGRGVTVRCPAALDLAVLADYWFGDLTVAEQERVEEHLLGCGECSDRLQVLVGTGEGVRRLARQGAFHMVVGPSFVEAASRQGLRVREYRVPPGGKVACTVTAEDDLVVTRLMGDFTGITKLDLVTQVEDGPEERIEDLPVASSAHELIVAQSMPALRALVSSTTRLRLLAREPGGDRLVGEYTFAHTASGR